MVGPCCLAGDGMTTHLKNDHHDAVPLTSFDITA
jgi:hypothetical protein